MTKGHPICEWIPCIPITDKDGDTQSEEDEKSSTHEDKRDDDITKMEKINKAQKKRNMEMSTRNTGRLIQVTTSSKIKTKMTKNTPPLKMMAQKK